MNTPRISEAIANSALITEVKTWDYFLVASRLILDLLKYVRDMTDVGRTPQKCKTPRFHTPLVFQNSRSQDTMIRVGFRMQLSKTPSCHKN